MPKAVDRLWKGFSSLSTTAALGIALATLVGVSAFVPQGWLAVELAGLERTEGIRNLHAWGLTNIAYSPWLSALCCLIVGNFIAVGLRIYGERTGQPADGAKNLENAHHKIEVSAHEPEHAAEQVRHVLNSALGRPIQESVRGSTVTLTYETAPRALMSPLMTHLGLVLLLVGAVFASRPAPAKRSVVRAELKVTDTRTGSVGIFDMAQFENRTFFQWPFDYSIQNYVQQKDGLGPAIQMRRLDDQRRQVSVFWVYLNAPPHFDARHRRGAVKIEARSMGITARPEAGMASRTESVLLLLGLGLLAIGTLELGRPVGQLVVRTDGRKVKLFGLPSTQGDKKFAFSFKKWAQLAQWAVTA